MLLPLTTLTIFLYFWNKAERVMDEADELDNLE